MFSAVTGLLWGEEMKEEGVRESEDEWVLVEGPRDEEQLYASAVAHMVPCLPSPGATSVCHSVSPPSSTMSTSLSHCVRPSPGPTRAITMATQTYKPRLEALVPLGGERMEEVKEEEEEESFHPRLGALVPLGGSASRVGSNQHEEAMFLGREAEERYYGSCEEDRYFGPLEEEKFQGPYEEEIEGELYVFQCPVKDLGGSSQKFFGPHEEERFHGPYEEEIEEEMYVFQCPLRESPQKFFGPHEEEKFYGPHEESKYFGPHEVVMFYGPHEKAAFCGPHEEDKYFGPHEKAMFFGPHEESVYFGPHKEKDQPWSPARALQCLPRPLALTGPNNLALTYQEKPSAVDQVLDFLLDCLPFPDSEEEVEEMMEDAHERSASPFSSNLAHTADATQVCLDLLSPHNFPSLPLPKHAPMDGPEENDECDYRRKMSSQRRHLRSRQFPTYKSYFS